MLEKLTMTKVTYICAATSKRVVGTSEALPDGWIVPPHDISQDEALKPLPRYTVIALSSEAAWKKLFEARLNKT
jgi:hypothetical protein